MFLVMLFCASWLFERFCCVQCVHEPVLVCVCVCVCVVCYVLQHLVTLVLRLAYFFSGFSKYGYDDFNASVCVCVCAGVCECVRAGVCACVPAFSTTKALTNSLKSVSMWEDQPDCIYKQKHNCYHSTPNLKPLPKWSRLWPWFSKRSSQGERKQTDVKILINKLVDLLVLLIYWFFKIGLFIELFLSFRKVTQQKVSSTTFI